LAYKPGWSFKIAGPGGRYLCAFARTPDSLHPERERVTQHMWEIPDELDYRGFARWALERLVDVERHEAAEFFQLDGRRPFWPEHDGGDAYTHVEHWD
jgi:hypothetical protein